MSESKLIGPAVGAGIGGLIALFSRKKRDADLVTMLSTIGGAAAGGAIGHVAQNAWASRGSAPLDSRFTPVESAPAGARVFSSSVLGPRAGVDPLVTESLREDLQLFKTDQGYIEAPRSLVAADGAPDHLYAERMADRQVTNDAAAGGLPVAPGVRSPEALTRQRMMYDSLLNGADVASAPTAAALKEWGTPDTRKAVMEAQLRYTQGRETRADSDLLSRYVGDVTTHQQVRSGFARGNQPIGDVVPVNEPGRFGMYTRLLPMYGTGQDIRANFGLDGLTSRNKWLSRAYDAQRQDVNDASGGWYNRASIASGAAEFAFPLAGMLGLAKVPTITGTLAAMTAKHAPAVSQKATQAGNVLNKSWLTSPLNDAVYGVPYASSVAGAFNDSSDKFTPAEFRKK
jgi:hypothetical protein